MECEWLKTICFGNLSSCRPLLSQPNGKLNEMTGDVFNILSNSRFPPLFFVFSLKIALLSGTLRTFHKTTCDSERVSLSCPRGTSISIEMAQYEKNGIGLY